MEKLLIATRRFLRDEEGVTAIEYGLIAALIAVVIIVGAGLVGTNLNTLFTDISDCLASPPGGAICG
jgi:pilus assembly protein Flp/PilA